MEVLVEIKGDIDKYKEEIIEGIKHIEDGETTYTIVKDNVAVLRVKRFEEQSYEKLITRLAESIEELTDVLRDFKRGL